MHLAIVWRKVGTGQGKAGAQPEVAEGIWMGGDKDLGSPVAEETGRNGPTRHKGRRRKQLTFIENLLRS